jgi:hypothetical protein
MGHHTDAAAARRLRAELTAVEALAERWEHPPPSLPEGWRCAWDLAQAAFELRQVLDQARRAT